MSWLKIDDDRTATDETLSAWLMSSLVRNCNAYASELSRSVSAAWSYRNAPTWTSWEMPIGTTIFVDVGDAATEVRFQVFCDVTRAGGNFVVSCRATGQMVDAPVALGDSSILVDLEFTRPLSGVQAFWVGWRGLLGETIGAVDVHAGSQNVITVHKDTADPSTFLGVAYLMLEVPSTVLLPAPDNVGRTQYQVCYVAEANLPSADGDLYVWPQVEENPPWIPVDYAGSKRVTGYLYEIGTLQLYSITCTVTATRAATIASVYAHDFATSPMAIVRATGAAYASTTKQLAGSVGNDSGLLGCMIERGKPWQRLAVWQDDRSVSLQVVLMAVSLVPTVSTVEFTFKVYDAALVQVSSATLTVVVPALAPQNSTVSTPAVMLAVNGASMGGNAWGQNDAHTLRDLSKAAYVVVDLPPFAAAAGAAYLVEVECRDAAIYVLTAYCGEV